jgi:large subunit ribosomal protein L3
MLRMGLLGKKIGMTQLFEDGQRIPVTVLELGPNVVIQKKTTDTKDGYNAIQIGFGDKAHSKINKAMKGHYERSDVQPKWFVREVVLDEAQVGEYEVGQELKADLFTVGQWVDVTGTSKGKGFQGVMRRWNMKGAKNATRSHEQFRHVGSIGCRSTPGEVDKGKRLPGQMGNERVTIQNVKIVKIDLEKNICMVAGSVPGARNGYVMVHHAIKKLMKM